MLSESAGTDTSTDRSPISLFIRLDRRGAVLGFVFVVVANGLFVRNDKVWIVLIPLGFLVMALTIAQRSVQSRIAAALAWIAAGNWIVALSVATMFPFLWPVMGLTVLMPLVLATPYLDGRGLARGIGGATLVAGAVGALGLLNDDLGVTPDINDTFELGLVVGALAAQIVPIGLIVWQNNRLQRNALEEATALNIRLERSQEQLTESRRRVVAAADAERSRIERDLHDGAQARLVAIGIRLRLLDAKAANTDLAAEVSGLLEEVEGASADLRELSHGIYPPLLESRGLREALRVAGRRFEGVSTAGATEVGRLGREIESALYFTCLEALTNASKHAPTARVRVVLSRENGRVILEVADDGPGFHLAARERSHGLMNMSDRIAAIGGHIDVETLPGVGTLVRATIPTGDD